MEQNKDYIQDEIYGERLQISIRADQTELDDNIRVAKGHEDFCQGILDECYVVHNSKAVVIMAEDFKAPDKETIKQIINNVIEKLRT